MLEKIRNKRNFQREFYVIYVCVLLGRYLQKSDPFKIFHSSISFYPILNLSIRIFRTLYVSILQTVRAQNGPSYVGKQKR